MLVVVHSRDSIWITTYVNYGTPKNAKKISYVHIYRAVKESKTQPPSILGITALQDLPAWCWWRDGRRLQQLLQACPHQDTHTHSSSAVAHGAPWKETVALLTTVKSKKFTDQSTHTQKNISWISCSSPVPVTMKMSPDCKTGMNM